MISNESLSALTEDTSTTSEREIKEIAAELLSARELIQTFSDILQPLWKRAGFYLKD